MKQPPIGAPVQYVQLRVAQATYDQITAVAAANGLSRGGVGTAVMEFFRMQLGDIVAMRIAKHHQGQAYIAALHDHEDGRGSTFCFQASCGHCGTFGWAGHSQDMRLPVEAVHQLFRKQGWHIGATSKKNRCGKCLGNEPKRIPSAGDFVAMSTQTALSPLLLQSGIQPPKPTEQSQPAGESNMTVLPAQQLQPRILSGAETRQVSALLEEHFDEKRGAYDDKWDDQVVADQVNVPRASVAKLRIEGWGAIKSFPDIEALKSDAVEMRKMIDEWCERIKAAERKRLGV